MIFEMRIAALGKIYICPNCVAISQSLRPNEIANDLAIRLELECSNFAIPKEEPDRAWMLTLIGMVLVWAFAELVDIDAGKIGVTPEWIVPMSDAQVTNSFRHAKSWRQPVSTSR